MKNSVGIIAVPGWAFVILLLGCNTNKGGNGRAVTSDSAVFYPVKQYFLQQIHEADSAAVFIYKTTSENGRRDSAVLNKKQFDSLAEFFLLYDISDKRVHNQYKENIFLDETTHSYTFNYTAADSFLALKSLDILLDIGSTQVKRVFLTVAKNVGGHYITVKAGWKTGDRFFINKLTEHGDSTTVQQNTIVWRNQP